MTKGAGKLKRQGSAGISSDQQESAVISRNQQGPVESERGLGRVGDED